MEGVAFSGGRTLLMGRQALLLCRRHGHGMASQCSRESRGEAATRRRRSTSLILLSCLDERATEGLVALSVVVPVFNEENNIGRQVRKVSEVIESMGSDKVEPPSYEIICVNDASCDQTASELAETARDVAQLRILEHRWNAGQSASLKTGLSSSNGKVVVTMDGDYQNDPRDLPLLLSMLEGSHGESTSGSSSLESKESQTAADGERNAFDLVCGYRENRREKRFRVLLSAVMNRIIAHFTGVKGVRIRDTGCGYKVMRRWVAKEVARSLASEMHRYIPYLSSNVGARVGQVPVRDLRREFGSSKYTSLGRLPRVLLDLILVCFMRKDNAFFFLGVTGLACLGLALLVLLACFLSSTSSTVLMLYLTACSLFLLGSQTLLASIVLFLVRSTKEQSVPLAASSSR